VKTCFLSLLPALVRANSQQQKGANLTRRRRSTRCKLPPVTPEHHGRLAPSPEVTCVDSVDVCSVLGRHLFRLRKRTSAKVRHSDTDVTFDADRTGWEGPVKGNKRLPDSNKGFPPLKIRNSFEPLNRVPETMDSAAAGTSSRPIETSSKRSDAGNTNKERPPPPVIIHGFVENFNAPSQHWKKVQYKIHEKNTTIYTQNKVDWNKVKNVLSQTETSYHSFTHKDRKTHAFVLQGLGQNPSVEEVQNAIKQEHDIETIKMYKMRGTNRPKYLVITDKTITQNQLETQARTSHLGPRGESPSTEAPKKVKRTNPRVPQTKPTRLAPANTVAQQKPRAENKIPPVIIRDASKWSSVSSAMTQRKIAFSKAQSCVDGTRVNPVSSDDFRALIHLFEERKVPFHSFTLPEEKTLRAVFRTVPVEINLDDVKSDLVN
jgi:hypothetical protein